MKMKVFVFVLMLPFFGFSQSDWIKAHFDSGFYKNQFTGFYLYDPASKQVLEEINAEKYFTPASNVKIFTLYSGMKILNDSIPALKYESKDGNLYIEGMGDPTLLHPKFNQLNKIVDFLKNETGNIYLYWGKFEGSRFGQGWSWEDYEAQFSPERSEFPVYGNILNMKKGKGGLTAEPKLFKDSIQNSENLFYRDYQSNQFYFGSRNGYSTKVPFMVNGEIVRKILSDAIGKEVILTNKPLGKTAKILYSLPTDLIFKEMMEESDNFLAEQILLMVSGQISSKMNTEKAIQYTTEKYLKGLPQKPVWVDGSGLSRYNLFSPKDMAFVLEKLYSEFPKDRLFNLFALGGKTGTLKSNYGGKVPYVYAKSGSLENNYNLSGYLITNSGKTLIFSVMNNHFTHETWQVRNETQKLLEHIRDNY